MTPPREEARRLLRLARRDRETFDLLQPLPQASLAALSFLAQQSVEFRSGSARIAGLSRRGGPESEHKTDLCDVRRELKHPCCSAPAARSGSGVGLILKPDNSLAPYIF